MTKKFRAGLLTGMGVLSLAAVGCGGGGGASLAVQTPPQVVIGAQVNPSLSSVGGGSGLQYSLGSLSGKDVFPQDVEVYSMDGELLSGVTVTCPGNKLPCTAALDAAALAKAQTQNSLVFRVKSGNLDYKAVAPDLSDLRNGITHSERIGVGFGSTLVAALVEDEMSNAAGESVVLGQAVGVEQSMKLRNFLDDASPVDPVRTVKAFRSAMEDTESALAEMSQNVALNIDPANADAAGGLGVAIRKFALEGENPTNTSAKPTANQVDAVRQVKSVASKMVALTKAETNTARKDKLQRLMDSVAKAKQADASVKAAAGNLVANTVAVGSKMTGSLVTEMTGSLDEVLAKIDSGAINANVAKSLVQETGDKVLPAMNDDVVQALAKTGNEHLFAHITGGVMAGSDYIDDADKKAELAAKAGDRLAGVVGVLSSESQKSVLGAAMGAAAANAAAVASVIQVAVSKGAKIVDLIEATHKSGTANVADVVRAVTEYAATDEGKEALNVASATDFLQSVVKRVGASNVALVQNRQNIVLADQTWISPAAVEVKVGQSIILSNASVAGDRTKAYTYKWKSANGTVLSTSSSVFTTTAATVGTYKIYLEQFGNGVSVSTPAEANVTVLAATALKAPVLISSRASTDRLDIFKARSATVNLDVLEPETTSTRALTIKANVTGTSGGVVAKWGTKALSGAQAIVRADAVKGLRIPVTIDAVTEGDYAIDFVLGYGSAGEVKRTVNVRVTPPAPKIISFVSLPASHIATTDLTINASLYSEQTSGTVTMKLKINDTLFRTWENLTVSAGSTSYTTVLSGGTMLAAPGPRTLELSLEESGQTTRYATKVISVYEQGAPVITGLRLARKSGTTLGTKANLVNGATYTVSTTDPAALVLNLEVLTSTETGVAVPTAYSVVKTGGGWSTSGTSATTDIVSIASGVAEYTVTAIAGGKSTSWKFSVDVRKIYEVTVSNLSISGAQGTAGVVKPVVAGVLPFDADGITGVTMINQNLKVVLVTTETSITPEVYDSNVRLVVELMDPASARRASMTIEGATLALTSTGFDITTAASVIAGAVRSDGTEVSRTLDADKVTDFAGLFTPNRSSGNATVEINVYKLKEAIKEILVSNYPDFAGRIDAMTGENLSLSISVTPSRMMLKSGTSQINGFAFINIDVE